MTPQFGTSLTDDSRVINYNCNIFIIEATQWRQAYSTGVPPYQKCEPSWGANLSLYQHCDQQYRLFWTVVNYSPKMLYSIGSWWQSYHFWQQQHWWEEIELIQVHCRFLTDLQNDRFCWKLLMWSRECFGWWVLVPIWLFLVKFFLEKLFKLLNIKTCSIFWTEL